MTDIASNLNWPVETTPEMQALIDKTIAQLGRPLDELHQDALYAAVATLQQQVYAYNVKAGWWNNLTTGEATPKGNVDVILAKLMLVTTELSEAAEGARRDRMDDKLPHRKMLEVELADAVIRILDICGHEGLDLAGAIREKRAYNAQRADHKLENRMADGGKKA